MESQNGKRLLFIVLAAGLLVSAAVNMFLCARNAGLREQVAILSDPGDGVRANGFLKVSGTRLVNARGEDVQLRGMSSHGLVWYPLYTNARAMFDIKGRGANLFRAAMYADSVHGGYNENAESKKLNKAFLYMAVENALAADIYVIADWHLLMDENPLRTVASATEFFDELSARYANEPGIIYEICNEPNGDTTWMDIYKYASWVIPVIRKNSPNALIIVGTPKFSTDILAPADLRLPFDNVMYSYHLYTGYSKDNYEHDLGSARSSGLPVFVTEWGISEDSETGMLDVPEAHRFIDYMKRYKISWANWSLSNAEEDYSAVKSDVRKLSGWTEDDLTDSGRVIFKALGDR